MQILITNPGREATVLKQVFKTKKARELGVSKVSFIVGEKIQEIIDGCGDVKSKYVKDVELVISFDFKSEKEGEEFSKKENLLLYKLVKEDAEAYGEIELWIPKTEKVYLYR